MGYAPYQPIWLTLEDGPPPNGARYLFLVGGATSSHLALYTRVFDLFDGNDPAAVAAARERYRAARAAGHTLTYWRQTAQGWEKAG
jgi:DNA polymerase-3 subunit chi